MTAVDGEQMGRERVVTKEGKTVFSVEREM